LCIEGEGQHRLSCLVQLRSGCEHRLEHSEPPGRSTIGWILSEGLSS
jgi:hypothetical protein